MLNSLNAIDAMFFHKIHLILIAYRNFFTSFDPTENNSQEILRSDRQAFIKKKKKLSVDSLTKKIFFIFRILRFECSFFSREQGRRKGKRKKVVVQGEERNSSIYVFRAKVP